MTTFDAPEAVTAWFGADPARLWLLLIPAALLVLVVLRLRRSKRPDRRVTMLATVVGLGWSAQGMWDSAVHTYRVVPVLAAVLFFLFESFMVGNMLRAARYRDDRVRRSRPVRFVWLTAIVMGVIVALAEGASQAPLRLAVPLLVAGNWWIELIADDDPADRDATSWRWTPRRIGLALGLLEPGERDAVTIDRDRLTAKLTALRFRQAYGDARIGRATGRPRRIAKLGLLADDAIVAESTARLSRAARLLTPEQPAPESHPAPPEQPEPPIIVPIPKPEPKPAPPEDTPRRPQGVHANIFTGAVLRGPALRADAAAQLLASVDQEHPRGVTAAQLAEHYTPPLGSRTAESIVAEARKRINGHALTQ